MTTSGTATGFTAAVTQGGGVGDFASIVTTRSLPSLSLWMRIRVRILVRASSRLRRWELLLRIR